MFFPQVMWKRFNWTIVYHRTRQMTSDCKGCKRMSKWEQEMVLLMRPILDLWFGVIQNWKRSVQTGFIKTWVYTINGAWLWLNFSGLEGYLELKNLGVRIIWYELEILEEFWDKACIYRTLWYFISNFAEQIMVMWCSCKHFFCHIINCIYCSVYSCDTCV